MYSAALWKGWLVTQTDSLPVLAEQAAVVLRHGGMVALPTDTQYALAVLAEHGAAVMRLFDLKGRPDDQALPILLPDPSWLDVVATDVPEAARAVAAAFWPGPLTLVLARNPAWRSLAVPGSTVAVRIPDHPLARAVLAAVAAPITGTSANRHNDPPPTTPDAIRDLFADAVQVLPPLAVMPQGVASTILDCTVAPPRILRAGALPGAAIQRVLTEQPLLLP